MPDVALKANLELLPTEERGRRNAIRSGYRPALWFGGTTPHGEPDLHSGVVRLRNRDEVQPGEKFRADILPVALGTWPSVRKGTRFDLVEGSRLVGRGELLEATASLNEADVRHALQETFEGWVTEKFGKAAAHREWSGKGLHPDIVLRFRDLDGHEQTLVGEVVPRGPQKRDVERTARLMERQEADFGVIVGLDGPSRAAEVSAYEHGRAELGDGLWIPRIRMLSTRSLWSWNPDLVPGAVEAETFELIES